MVSHRHRDQAVLDAVRHCVLEVGVRRTTLTDVARRAGVSRMTLYRHYPDLEALVRDLMTREFAAVLAAGRERAARDGDHGRAQLVRAVLLTAAGLRANPVFRRVLDVEPDLLLPYVTDRIGSTQRIAAEFFAAAVATGQADGSIRSGDRELLAYGLVLLTQPFVLSAKVVAHVLDERTLEGELARVLDAYLRPEERR